MRKVNLNLLEFTSNKPPTGEGEVRRGRHDKETAISMFHSIHFNCVEGRHKENGTENDG